MVCSDCHDPHGQDLDNLKEETVNLLCYKCHAEKQGPFAFEHPPVTERCTICHEPHGTVANNLLRQPATFLCLRCHAGHAMGSATSRGTTGTSSNHGDISTAARRSARLDDRAADFQKALLYRLHALPHSSPRLGPRSVTGHGFLMR